jgi:hypothetical protein
MTSDRLLPGPRTSVALGFVLFAAAAGTSFPPGAGAETPPQAPADLPPLRRVLLPPERVQVELDRAGRGVLRELPRAEFEEKVRRAAAGAESRRHPPRLAEARYRARLAEGSLAGTGQWKVAWPGPGPALLPLQPLNLALGQARFENRDALVADFDGKTPSLLLAGPADHTVAIEWSARAEERPGGLHFDLKLPACPVAVLELDLPADRVASTADGSLLSGPHAAEAPDRRLWRVGCGGQPGVDLWVRPAGAAARPTLLLARQYTTQTLAPEGLEASYQFDLELLHREASELVLECDAELRPYEVAVPGLAGWDLGPPAKSGAPALLTVRLNEPVRYGRETLLVRCLAPLAGGRPEAASAAGAPEPPPVEWHSPGVRLVDAVPCGETLTLLLQGDLRPDALDAGDFRLTGNAFDPTAGDAGEVQRLTFAGGGLAGPGGVRRRPSLRVRPLGVDYQARELAWWQPTGEPPSLTLQIGYEVERGRLFQLPVLLPAGWDVDRAEMVPPGLLRNWSVRPTSPEAVPSGAAGGGEGRLTLVVELQRPLTAAARERGEAGLPALLGRPRVPTLTVRLVPKGNGPGPGGPLPFPDAVPLRAGHLEGVLAIGYEPQTYQAALVASAAETELEDDGPWGRQVPDAVYQYRGRPVEGTLVLRPRPPQVRARCVSDVRLSAGLAAVETRLVLEAESGRPTGVDLSVSAPTPSSGHADAGWHWRVEPRDRAARSRPENAVRSFDRHYPAEAAEGLAALGAGQPLAAAVLLAARPPGERWRLTLDRPLRAGEPLELRAARRLEPRAGHWDVPLPSVAGARRMDGEVTLHLAGAEYVTVEADGLQEAPPATPAPGRPRVGTPWRTFRYGDASVSLTLRGPAGTADRADEAVTDQARLMTRVGADWSARHAFAFRVSNWRTGRTLPLRLPPGARLVAVQVDGHPATAASADPVDGEDVLALPVPSPADAPCAFEVVYDTAAPAGAAWRPWTTFEAPAPVLPVPALTFRRTWRLPPGLAPVPDGRHRRLPGTGGADSTGLPLGLSAQALLATPLAEAVASHPAAVNQAEALAAAAIGLRPKAGRRVVRLRELVAEMWAGFLNGRLVVDDAALREAGLDTESLLTVEPPAGAIDHSPPWQALGLSAVAAGPAPLLTTAARSRQWGEANGPPRSVRAAVAEAAVNGHDPSGCYRAAPDWIRHSAEVRRGGDGEDLPGLGPASGPWSEWEPAAGVADDSTLAVVRHDAVVAGGVLLAAALVPGLWLCRRRDLLLVGWLGVAVPAALWLPSAVRPLVWLPLLAGVAAALGGYLAAAARRSVRRLAPASGATAVVAVAVALFVAGQPGVAEEPTLATVYLLPGPAGAPGEERVLAPPELLDRLDALAHSAPAGTEPVLLSAAYEGKAAGAVAEFQAVYEAYCPAEAPAALALAFDGIHLDGDVLVDGARALPAALPAPQGGISVGIRGAGRHRVELRFRVPVVDEGGGRGVRFAAPRVCQSRLRLKLPPGATAAQALVKHGGQNVRTDAGGVVLEADLGRVTAPLHVRWTEDGRPGKVEVREAYLWDLNAEGNTLTGWLDCRVDDGSVSALLVDLPPGLEVEAAEARRAGPGEAVRLRDWTVSGNGPARVLELELASPTAGSFQVGLTLVPSAPPGAQATLPLPAPRAAASAQRSHLAYRARGVRAALEGTRWLTGEPAEAFAPFWPEASRPDLSAGGPAVYTATFRRENGQVPMLRLHLVPAPPRLRVERQQVRARVFAHHAEVEAALRVAVPDGDAAALTCRIRPARMTVSAVRGDGVRRWSQDGERLTVWLGGGAAGERDKATPLDVTGWLPFAAATTYLQIPSVHVEGAEAAAPESVRLVPEPGLALVPEGLQGLRPVAAAEPELAFVAERPDFGGGCEVRAGAAGAAVRLLTLAEVRDGRLAFRSAVEFAAAKGELRSAEVRLRNWEGEDVKLDVQGAVPLRQCERRRAANDRTWALELRPGVTGKVRLILSGSVPLEEAAAGLPMPEVTVPGVAPSEALVAAAGPDLAAEGPDGLSPVGDVAVALKDWPDEAARLRPPPVQVWRVAADEWALRLRPRGGAGAGPVRILLVDHAAAVADGHRWLHEAVYWVRHGANTDLNLLLPKPGVVVAVAVDGVDVAPLQPGPQRLWLPLPGRAGVRAVRVRWRYVEPAEPLARPLLTTPVVEGADGGPGVWTVYLPAGFEAIAGAAPAPLPGPGRAAEASLYRAEAQLRISAAVAAAARDGPVAPLASAQERFYAACRQAARALQLADDPAVRGGPKGESLDGWLRSLLEENRKLAHESGFEEARAEAERRSDAAGAAPRSLPEEADPAAFGGPAPAHVRGPLPDAGTPAYLSSADPMTLPALSIRPEDERRWRELLAETAAWMALVAAALAVAMLPRLQARLRPFWPEPLLLVGLFAWYRTGLTAAAALFLLLGVSGRLLALVDAIRRLLRRQPSVPAAAANAGVAGSAS